MKPLVICVALLLGLVQQQETYKVRLSPVPLDATTRASTTGKGIATATLSGRTLSINGTFDGLQTAATIAQLHRGKATGVRGPAVGELTIAKATSGTLGGSVDLTAEQVDGLHKGQFYIQIHSEKAPDGNLWGWLLK